MTQNLGRLPDTAIRAYDRSTSNILSITTKGQIAKRPRLAMGESDRVLIAAEVIVMDALEARLRATSPEGLALLWAVIQADPELFAHIEPSAQVDDSAAHREYH